VTRPTTKPDTKPGASAPAILQRILEGRPFTIEDADEVMDYVDTQLARSDAADTAVATMRAAINERVSERDAAKDHAKALAAALDGAIATIERGYAPSVADKAALAAAPFRAALAAYREGGTK
jgi:hypothetical protein